MHTGKAGEETHGKGTIARKSNETKEFNCVLNGGHTTTFPARSKLDGPWQRSNSEFDVVAMRKDTSVLEREMDHRKELSSEDRETIAIRTSPLSRICINSGVDIVRTASKGSSVGTPQNYLRNVRDAPRKHGKVLQHRLFYKSYLFDRNRP